MLKTSAGDPTFPALTADVKTIISHSIQLPSHTIYNIFSCIICVPWLCLLNAIEYGSAAVS